MGMPFGFLGREAQYRSSAAKTACTARRMMGFQFKVDSCVSDGEERLGGDFIHRVEARNGVSFIAPGLQRLR